MRLKQRDIDAIQIATRATFGGRAVPRLFGSRTDDSLRGGDIDLVIEVETGQDTFDNECAFRRILFDHIDEQKVDLVLFPRNGSPSAFARLAMSRSVLIA